ncbi:hypothetical protein IAI18_08170 [Acetobacteraceae bacterium H6797]|nr:hypothetical protein [Acetobacteraceae bacterium H6797]
MLNAITRRTALSLVGTAAASLAARPAAAQNARTGRAIVGFPAGGTADSVTRLYVERLRASGIQMIVDNRPGAGGRIALETLKPLAADGSNLVLTPSGMLTIYPHLYTRSLRYDPVKDFTPVTPVCKFPFGLAVAARHPARTLAEFIAWAKTREAVDWAAPVPGSAPHFMGTELARLAGITMNHVPYRGSAPAATDLIGGTLQAVILPLGELTAFHRGGEARLLAVTSEARLPRLPDVPTFAESGFPAITGEEWYGIFLPAGAPAATVIALNQALVAAAATTEIRDALTRIDLTPYTLNPDDFRTRIAQELSDWGPIVAASGFRPDD